MWPRYGFLPLNTVGINNVIKNMCINKTNMQIYPPPFLAEVFHLLKSWLNHVDLIRKHELAHHGKTDQMPIFYNAIKQKVGF